MAAAKLDHHLLRGLVFDRPQALQHVLPAGIQFLGRQARTPQDVGENGQRGGQVLGQRGPAIGDPRAGDRGMVLDAQVVQVENELPAVARPRPAERHLAGQRGQSLPFGRLVDATGRHEEGKRRRLQPMHRLGQEHQAVGKNMREDGSCH